MNFNEQRINERLTNLERRCKALDRKLDRYVDELQQDIDELTETLHPEQTDLLQYEG